jgi:hypothetical protein
MLAPALAKARTRETSAAYRAGHERRLTFQTTQLFIVFWLRNDQVTRALSRALSELRIGCCR